ncbi:hypothetical protein OAI10_01145 [bacterium]|nr:hypothetical protein [bacterium]
MKVFLKLNFEEPQEYFFNGYVNNEESNDIDLSVKELNENPTIILDSGYETINGMQTLKEGVTHPFNLFSFGFKSTNTPSETSPSSPSCVWSWLRQMGCHLKMWINNQIK